MSLVLSSPYINPSIKFAGNSDIETAYSDNAISNIVDKNVKRYQTININNAMTNLAQVGSLLQLAYSGSKGFPCSKDIIKILSNYQSLIKDSGNTSSIFVDASLKSLKTHQLALIMADKNHYDKALTLLNNCGKLAGEMAKASEELVKKSQSLCDLSGTALETATSDEVFTIQEREKIKKTMDEFQAKQTALASKTKELAEQVAEERENEMKAARESKDARDKAFTLSLVSAIVEPVMSIAGSALKAYGVPSDKTSKKDSTNEQQEKAQKDAKEETEKAQKDLKNAEAELDSAMSKKDTDSDEVKKAKISAAQNRVNEKKAELKRFQDKLEKIESVLYTQADNAEKKENDIAKRRFELQRELRDSNSDLAESVVRLKNLNVEKNDLNTSIIALEIVVKTLGKVKTVFENSRQFWMGVETQCKSLSAMFDDDMLKIFADGTLKDIFIDNIKESGLSWLALAKINLIAYNGIALVNNKVDGIMSDLPTKQESLKLISELTDQLENQLKLENNNLTA